MTTKKEKKIIAEGLAIAKLSLLMQFLEQYEKDHNA